MCYLVTAVVPLESFGFVASIQLLAEFGEDDAKPDDEDAILIAQPLPEDCTLVTNDKNMTHVT